MADAVDGQIVGVEPLKVMPVHRVDDDLGKVRMRRRQLESVAHISDDVAVSHRLSAPARCKAGVGDGVDQQPDGSLGWAGLVVSDQVDRCTHDWTASCRFQADRLTDAGCDDLTHLAPQIVGRVGRGAEHDYTLPGTGDQKKADFTAS
jgi:hypothetical protein